MIAFWTKLEHVLQGSRAREKIHIFFHSDVKRVLANKFTISGSLHRLKWMRSRT